MDGRFRQGYLEGRLGWAQSWGFLGLLKIDSYSIVISTAESALAGIAALIPVGSAPAPFHTKHEPQPSCRACGTYLDRRNAPGSNWPIRHVPTPRRYASDRPLDHRAWQWPRHDLAVRLAKAEFVAIGRKAQQSAASRLLRPIPPPHERPQSQPAACKSRSGGTSELQISTCDECED